MWTLVLQPWFICQTASGFQFQTLHKRLVIMCVHCASSNLSRFGVHNRNGKVGQYPTKLYFFNFVVQNLYWVWDVHCIYFFQGGLTKLGKFRHSWLYCWPTCGKSSETHLGQKELLCTHHKVEAWAYDLEQVSGKKRNSTFWYMSFMIHFAYTIFLSSLSSSWSGV